MISWGCVNKIEDVNRLTQIDRSVFARDTVRGVTILYSDSARLKVEIEAPTLVRHLNRNAEKDEFPDGIFVKFYNEQERVGSKLKADYAVKIEAEDLIIARYNVELYNSNNEKLESPELIWDEKEARLYTDKPVRITKPETGDTTYGTGFIATDDFSRFEIKSNYSARINREAFKKSLEGKE